MRIREVPDRSIRTGHVLLLVLVALTGLAFLNSPGTDDLRFWLTWSTNMQELGLRHGYAANQDVYPPLTALALSFATRVGSTLGLGAVQSIKWMLWLSLGATTTVFLAWTRRPLLAALLCAALMMNAVALTYTDILYAPFLLLAFWKLQKGNWALFGTFYAITVLFKWTPLILGPIILIHLFGVRRLSEWREIPWRRIVGHVAAPAAAIIALIVGVFGVEVISSLLRVRSVDPFLSGNALNLNWVVTFVVRATGWMDLGTLRGGEIDYLVSEAPRLTVIPNLLFGISYAGFAALYFSRRRSFRGLLEHCQVAFLCYFMFATRVHENHLFIVVLLSAVLLAFSADQAVTFAFWCIAANLNQLLFYGLNGKGLGFSRVAFIDVTLPVAIASLSYFSMQCLSLWKNRKSADGDDVHDVDRDLSLRRGLK